MSLPINDSLARYAVSANSFAPRHLHTRYDANGIFLEEPGNTVVCHLINGSPSQAVILEVRQRLLALPEADKFTFTPISSLHMTLFQGIIEYRRRPPYWPDDVSLNTPIDEMTRIYLDRLNSFRGCGSFNVRVIDVTPVGLTVIGATERDVQTMKAWRDALSMSFGYRHLDHDDYVFHITFAYPLDWLPDERLPEWQGAFDQCRVLLGQEAPVIELQPPAFCSFLDMNHFEELLVFDGSEGEPSPMSISTGRSAPSVVEPRS